MLAALDQAEHSVTMLKSAARRRTVYVQGESPKDGRGDSVRLIKRRALGQEHRNMPADIIQFPLPGEETGNALRGKTLAELVAFCDSAVPDDKLLSVIYVCTRSMERHYGRHFNGDDHLQLERWFMLYTLIDRLLQGCIPLDANFRFAVAEQGKPAPALPPTSLPFVVDRKKMRTRPTSRLFLEGVAERRLMSRIWLSAPSCPTNT